ncbi:MAG: hypothetical protein BV459_00255 [Thermoplasmata archaeon M11B2D]|nr:MAG: hypothetical protein BV459_00255 [Thermoplasmata archaeon M11B2D]
MTAIITKKSKINNAKNFIESFYEKSPDYMYLFIGRNSAWPNEAVPPVPLDTVYEEIQRHTELMAGKKINETGLSLVIPRHDWVSGTIYAEYDDQDPSLFTKNFYVINNEFDVFKCVSNNGGAASTNMPDSGDAVSGSNTGMIETSDGYVWKFMYNVNAQMQQYLTANWIPVRDIYFDDGSAQANQKFGAVDGAIHRYIVLDGGSGYTTATVSIVGVGSGATATATISGGAITEVFIDAADSAGSGYFTEPVVTIVGDGSGADVRAVLSPIGGHGYDAVRELGGHYAMAYTVLESDEGGTFPVDLGGGEGEFRVFGLIKNPRSSVDDGLYMKITGFDACDIAVGDTLEKASDAGVNGTVFGFDWKTQEIYVGNITGTFVDGDSVKKSGSAVIGSISDLQTNYPMPIIASVFEQSEFLAGTGDILYVENRLSITRNLNQNEEVRLVVEF